MKQKKLNLLIIAILVLFVFYPVLLMLINVKWDTFGTLITSKAFKEALFNSIFITIIATIISVIVAYIFSYTLNRTNIKHRAVLKVLITIPMLIPSISHGLGLINLFGKNGIITEFFSFDIIGPVGIIIGSVIYSFPVAFLIIDDGYSYINNSMYDSAKVLGLNKLQTFFKVTFCYLKKPILSATFAVFAMIFTDYGVPLALGGNYITMPVFLYKEVIGLLDYSKGTIIGLFLLVPAFISFVFDTFSKDYSSNEFTNKEYRISENKIRDIVFKVITYLILIFIFVLIGSFVYYAFLDDFILNKTFSLTHFEYVFKGNIGKYIFNSVFIAMAVSIIGTIIAFASAYITARVKGKSSRVVHILSIASLSIPGIVLGLAYSIGFKNTFIYNTYIILIIVNIVHFMASPYLMAYNALQKVNPNYEVVAKTCNISIFKMIIKVILPCTKKTILEMISYFFVNSMITISAVTFLFNTNTMPLSLLINQYEGSMMLEEAAIVSLIILIINLIVKASVYIINRHDYNKEVRRIENEVEL